jgi:DNA primase
MINKFEYVKSQLKLEDIAKKYADLTHIGNNYLKGKCPFKDCVDTMGEKFTELFKKVIPDYVKNESNENSSFVVSSNKQCYYCFRCGKSGDVIVLTQRLNNLSPNEAIDQLSSEYNIDISKY